jgi:hypothetical protein
MMVGFSVGTLIALFAMSALSGGLRSLPPILILLGSMPVAVLFDRLTPRVLDKVQKRRWPLLGVVGTILAIALFITAWKLIGSAQA